jgi:hypothetical protein
MAWADSREHALDLPDDVMKPGVFVEVTPAPKD